MSDYRDNRRWFLRHGGDSQPFVEVTKIEWIQAEWDAGFRGGGPGEPATDGFGSGSVNGIIVYGHEAVPAGALELIEEPPTVTYEWGHQLRHDPTVAWGAVRESYEDNHADAETRARQEVEAGIRLRGYGTGRLVRRRVVTYGWEAVPGE